MAKHFIDRLRAELALLYNGSDTFVLALLDGTQASYNFTVDPSSGTFTAANHNFVNGVRIQLTNSGGALPAGTVTGRTYYCVNVASNTFQLASAIDGDALPVGNAGSGTNTVTEMPLDETDGMNILIRHEINYQQAAARPHYIPDAAVADYLNRLAYLAQKNITFTPTAGTITFRYSLLIRNGATIAGDITGMPDNIQDYGTTQSILANTTKGIEVYIVRKDA